MSELLQGNDKFEGTGISFWNLYFIQGQTRWRVSHSSMASRQAPLIHLLSVGSDFTGGKVLSILKSKWAKGERKGECQYRRPSRLHPEGYIVLPYFGNMQRADTTRHDTTWVPFICLTH